MQGVGIVGCGFIANYHAAAIRHLARLGLCDVRIAAVHDSDHARADAVAAGEARIACDPVDLVDGEDVDIVYVCTPTASHAAIVEAAAEAGKAVFCEKPLAVDLATASAMSRTVASVPNQVGLVLRYSPTYQGIRRRIGQRSAGPVMHVVLRDDQFIPIRGHYGSTWRSDVDQAGAGTVLEHSIHDVDVLTWLGGPIAAVTAVTRNVAGHPGIEDNAAVLFEFTSGAVATLSSVWHDVDTRVSSRHLEVLCRDIWLATDHDMIGPVEVHDARSQIEIEADTLVDELTEELGLTDPALGRSVAYVLEDWAFLTAIAGGRTPTPGFDDAVAAHRIVDAIYRSAATGRRVVLEGTGSEFE